MKENGSISLRIDSIGHGGNGVGRHDGMAVFVPATAAGDVIRARIVKHRKTHAFGILEELLTPSPDRVENDCPVYPQCGGCALRHLSYGAELRTKERWVADNLQRIGGIDLSPAPIIPSPRVARYRNKAQYPVRLVDGRVQAGFFAPRSHRLIPVEDCLLQPVSFQAIVRTVTAFMQEHAIAPYDEKTHTGIVRHIFIRWAETTGETMVCLVLNADHLPGWETLLARLRMICPSLASFGIDSNTRRTNVVFGGRVRTLWGEHTITDTLGGVALDLAPLSFYQVNRLAAEALFAIARSYADPGPQDAILDLYCGVGAVGLGMAAAARQLVGVEIVPDAVDNARHNAKVAGLNNTRFLCADAAEATRLLLAEGFHPDILLLDPPRKGADPAVLASIAAFSPGKVVYLSCNSATLARDAKSLAAHGYRVQAVQPVDLFPRTAGVECCALLTKG